MPAQSHDYRKRTERLLAALRYFCADGNELRPMQDAPKGTGWTTIRSLEKAGLIEQAGVASGIRKTPFRTTDAGRAVLAAEEPLLLLPPHRRGVSYAERRDAAQAAEAEQEADDGRTTASPAASRWRGARLDHSYPPMGLSREEAARYVGIGATKFDELVKDGRMPRAKRIDGRKVWLRLMLDAALFDLPDDGAGGNTIDDAVRKHGYF